MRKLNNTSTDCLLRAVAFAIPLLVAVAVVAAWIKDVLK
jgi:hypothetical protein